MRPAAIETAPIETAPIETPQGARGWAGIDETRPRRSGGYLPSQTSPQVCAAIRSPSRFCQTFFRHNSAGNRNESYAPNTSYRHVIQKLTIYLPYSYDMASVNHNSILVNYIYYDNLLIYLIIPCGAKCIR